MHKNNLGIKFFSHGVLLLFLFFIFSGCKYFDGMFKNSNIFSAQDSKTQLQKKFPGLSQGIVSILNQGSEIRCSEGGGCQVVFSKLKVSNSVFDSVTLTIKAVNRINIMIFPGSLGNAKIHQNYPKAVELLQKSFKENAFSPISQSLKNFVATGSNMIEDYEFVKIKIKTTLSGVTKETEEFSDLEFVFFLKCLGIEDRDIVDLKKSQSLRIKTTDRLNLVNPTALTPKKRVAYEKLKPHFADIIPALWRADEFNLPEPSLSYSALQASKNQHTAMQFIYTQVDNSIPLSIKVAGIYTPIVPFAKMIAVPDLLHENIHISFVGFERTDTDSEFNSNMRDGIKQMFMFFFKKPISTNMELAIDGVQYPSSKDTPVVLNFTLEKNEFSEFVDLVFMLGGSY